MLKKNVKDAKALLKILEKQENDFIFESFSNEDALALGIILTDVTKNTPSPLSMRIFIDNIVVFQYTMDGDCEKRFDWTERKYNLIKKTGHSSMHGKIRAIYLKELQDLVNKPDKFGFGCGGFPIIIKNKGIVGAITVSGLPDPLDHFYVVKALEKMFNIKTSSIPKEIDESWFKNND